MTALQTCIQKQVNIDAEILDEILCCFESRKIKKGEFFLKSGKTCREMAFIESGYLRMYDIVDGKEITFWISNEGSFITSVSSFIFQTENYWNIQSLSGCTLLVINRESHFQLCDRYPKWLEFDNLILAHSFAMLEQNMFAQLHMTAQQRFDGLMKREPSLFNQVPLQYIASMLGITPESLSRLRKNSSFPNS